MEVSIEQHLVEQNDVRERHSAIDDPLVFAQVFWNPAEMNEQGRRAYNNLSLTAKVQFKKG